MELTIVVQRKRNVYGKLGYAWNIFNERGALIMRGRSVYRTKDQAFTAASDHYAQVAA